jgi:Icc-related predicted phosphoesterase
VTRCLFASDLHGSFPRYEKLFLAIETHGPAGVFLGGDLLPHWSFSQVQSEDAPADFVADFLAEGFESLRGKLGRHYPEVFLILGNDDPRSEETFFLELARSGLWSYAHQRCLPFREWHIIPETHRRPFAPELK